MRDRSLRVMATAGLLLACVACSKPEPPEKERPVEPQATEVRDAIREPIDRAEDVEDAVLEAAETQQDAIEAAAGG